MKRFLAIVNPINRTGGWAVPDLAVIAAILVAVSFAAGWGARGRHDAAYYASHFQAPQPLPRLKASVPYKATSLPATGSVNLSRYPGVGNQGPFGSCAAWATAWDLSYDWRIGHSTSSLRFNPRQMYSHFSDKYSGGQDGGSWPDQDAEISSTTGLLQFKMLPYPPFLIDNPELPLYDNWGHLSTVDAAKHRFYVGFTALSGFSEGAGYGLVQSMKGAIQANRPVLIGFPVFPEYDNATSQPNVVGPKPGEVDRGGHENVAIAYDDGRAFPDGTHGGFEVQNQWTTAWGILGRAWISYDFVARIVFGAETTSISTSAPRTTAPPPWFPSHGSLHKAPPIKRTGTCTICGPGPSASRQLRPGGSYWYVRNVVTHDTHVNVSGMMNYWGDRFGVPPLGLAATAGVESGVDQYADRCCIPGDTSYGMTQETTGTVCGYVGICSNAGVKAYLDNPNNSIYLEARYYHDALAYHGGRVGFPAAYGLYNCGPGLADWFYNTYQDCHMDNFLGWWSYTLANYAGPPPPRPVFPAKIWNGFRAKHHLPLLSHRGHGPSLWWRYGAHRAGPVISHEQYFHPRHQHGYMTQRFAFRRLYWWPRTNWVKWQAVHPIE